MIVDETLRAGYEFRGYTDEDEEQVLDLLSASLGAGPTGERSSEVFRWKHIDNPFGRSFMLVVVADHQIVGFRSFMRWRLQAGTAEVRAVRAVDTATHPDHQGRGIFSALTRRAVEELRDEVDLIFNTPNGKSGPGYLKMGWELVGSVPIAIRVRRPLRFARRSRSFREVARPEGTRPSINAEPAPAAFEDEDALTYLLEASRRVDPRLATPRTVDYLRWRYASSSCLDYRVARFHRAGRLVGLAVFRVRARGGLWETTVSELICQPDDSATARRLLGEVVRASRVDHVTCHFPAGTVQRKVAARLGFVPAPVGMQFMANRLNEVSGTNPSQLPSWALSLGDVEVF